MKINPKAEIRRPKEGRNPKFEKTPYSRATENQTAGLSPISGFGLLSAFGLRISDFRRGGYLLIEALVYIGVVFLLLGIGSAALYRCIDNSVALRRNADDIARVVHAGELWRADIRGAKDGIAWDNGGPEPLLRLRSPRGVVEYRYDGAAVLRRVDSGSWSRIIDQVKVSVMSKEPRPAVSAWRWELELQPTARGSFKPGRIRPLFTFLSVAPIPVAP